MTESLKLQKILGRLILHGKIETLFQICITNADRPYMAGDLPVIPWQMVFGLEWLAL